jgi:hypothetical protein
MIVNSRINVDHFPMFSPSANRAITDSGEAFSIRISVSTVEPILPRFRLVCSDLVIPSAVSPSELQATYVLAVQFLERRVQLGVQFRMSRYLSRKPNLLAPTRYLTATRCSKNMCEFLWGRGCFKGQHIIQCHHSEKYPQPPSTLAQQTCRNSISLQTWHLYAVSSDCHPRLFPAESALLKYLCHRSVVLARTAGVADSVLPFRMCHQRQ